MASGSIVEVYDIFNRTVASGSNSALGTATDGSSTWGKLYNESGGTPSSTTDGVSSGTMTVTIPASATRLGAFVQNKTAVDMNMLSCFSLSASSGRAQVYFRSTSNVATGNCYTLTLTTATIELGKLVSNTYSAITTFSYTTALSTSTKYWCRAIVKDNNISIKTWKDGTAEPALPQVITTDSSYTSAGYFGIGASSSAASNVSFYDLYFIDYQLADADTLIDASTTTVITQGIDTGDTLTLSETYFAGIIMPDGQLTPSESFSFALQYNSTEQLTLTTTEQAYIVAPYVPPGTATLYTDNCNRTTSVGSLGTASDGTPWVVKTNIASSGNVNGSQIQVKESSAGQPDYEFIAYLNGTKYQDCEILCEFLHQLPSDGTAAMLAGRYDPVNGYYVQAGFTSTSSTFGIQYINANTSGSVTTVNSSTSVSLTANTWYWIRFKLVGIYAMAKWWKDGTAEPAAWAVQATLTNNSNTLYKGFNGFFVGAGSLSYAMLDNLMVVDYSVCDLVNETESLNDNLTFSITEAQSSLDTMSFDTGRQLTDTSTIVDAIMPTDIALTTDTLVSSDLVAASSVSSGMFEFGSVTITESVLFAQSYTASIDALTAPDDSLSQLTTIWSFPVDALIFTENSACVELYVPTENLASTDNATFSRLNPLADTPLAPSDTINQICIYLGVDNVIPSDGLTENFERILEDVGLITNDTATFSIPEPLVDAPLTVAETSVFLLVGTQQESVFTEVETIFFSETLSAPVDAAQLAPETGAYASSVSLTDTLSSADNLTASTPLVTFPDVLSTSDSFAWSIGPRLDLFTDQLLVTDNLFTIDNFTDVVVIIESFLITQQNVILEPRSVLYQNIIPDAPTVYYQLNEDEFHGVYQRDGQDQPANAQNPNLIGATLEYTWAQIEPQEGTYNWSLIDNDILPWQNQDKQVIIRVFTSSTQAYNNVAHYNNTCVQATPQWVFDAGAPMITGYDGVVYPVYWNAIYQAKYQAFIQQLALQYDTNYAVSGVIAACGVNGTTQLESSGDTKANTTALWTPRGYTAQTWLNTIINTVNMYQEVFLHTPVVLSVNSAVIVPDTTYNISQTINIAVSEGAWLMDENASVTGSGHTDPSWNVVPLIVMPAAPTSISGSSVSADIQLAKNFQANYAGVWAQDATNPNNQDALSAFANVNNVNYLHESMTGQWSIPVFGGIYPTSHISTGDYYNGAQQFDGLTGYAMITDSPQSNTKAWTLKASVYPSVLPTEPSIFVSNGQDGASAYGGYAMGIASGADGLAGQNFCGYLPGIGWLDSGYAFPAQNQWYACWMVFDGNVISFYVNNQLCPNTYSITPNQIVPRFTIGSIWDGVEKIATKQFIGSIDEVAVYPFAIATGRLTVISAAELGLSDGIGGTTSVLAVQDTPLTIVDASTFTHPQNIVDTALSITEGFAYNSVNTATLGYKVYGQDNYNRANTTNTWGKANDGQTWSKATGDGTASISSNQGKIVGPTSSTDTVMLLGTVTGTRLFDARVRFQSNDSGDLVGIVLRASSDGSSYYRTRINGASDFGIVVSNNGSVTNLITGVSVTHSANTGYWIRFKIIDSFLLAKYWQDGTAEPVQWTASASDSTFTSGQIGLQYRPASGGNTVLFDNFFVVDSFLADYIPLTEQYSFGKVLPPFVDALANIGEQTLITDTVVQPEPVLTVDESTSKFTPIMLGVDQLQPAISAISWQVSSALNDPFTVREMLLSTMARTMDTDSVSISDVSTTTDVPVLVDQLLAMDQTLQRIGIWQPLDQATISDSASSYTQIYPFKPDTVSTHDIIVPNTINQRVDALSYTDGLSLVEVSLLVDITLSGDICNSTDIVFLSDVVTTSDGIGASAACSLIDTTLSMPSDTIAINLAVSIAENIELTLIHDDTIINTVSETFPVDALTTAEQKSTLVQQTNIDAGLALEVVLFTMVDRPVIQVTETEQQTDILTLFITESTPVAEIMLPTLRPMLVDPTLLAGDTLMDLDTEGLIDTVTTTDYSTVNERVMLTDSVVVSEAIKSTVQQLRTDQTTLVTDGLFTSDWLQLNDLVILSESEFTPETLSITELTIVLPDSDVVGEFVILVDHLSEVESRLDALRWSAPVDSITCSDSISVTTANTYTWWTDQLQHSEGAAYAALFVPQETTNDIESFHTAISEVLRENAFTLSESNTVSLAPVFAEALALSERGASTVNQKESTSFFLNESAAYTPQQTQREALAFTESFSQALVATSIESMSTSERYSAATRFSTLEGLNLTGIETFTGVMLDATQFTVRETTVFTPLQTVQESVTITDLSRVTPGMTPVDALTIGETVSSKVAVSSLEGSVLHDVSTTMTTIYDTAVVGPLTESTAYRGAYTPTERVPVVDASTTKESVSLSDMLSAQEYGPTTAYKFIDQSLYITDEISAFSQQYIKTQAIVSSNSVKAIISTGDIEGIYG